MNDEPDDRAAIEAHIDGPRDEHEGHLHTILRDIAEEGWPAARKGIVEVMHQWRMKESDHITFVMKQAILWHAYHATGPAPDGAELAVAVSRFHVCTFRPCEEAREYLSELGFDMTAIAIPMEGWSVDLGDPKPETIH